MAKVPHEVARQQNINRSAASATAAINLSNAIRDRHRDLDAASRMPPGPARDKALANAQQGMRDAQKTAIRNIGDQFLHGKDKERFDVAMEAASILRDRIASGKGLIPDFSDLFADPDGKASWMSVLSGRMGSLGELAKTLGLEGELNQVKRALEGADKLLSGGLGGVGLEGLAGGLGLANGLADMLGGNKMLADAKKIVGSMQDLQKLFDGDLVAGIDSILALDGIVPIPPELKKALEDAKELVKKLRRFSSLKPMKTGIAGVYADGKHIAAINLSQTACPMVLPGTGPGPGALTVKVYAMRVWRVSDIHFCPIPGQGGVPHGLSHAITFSPKTKVEGSAAVRHDDLMQETNPPGPVKIGPKPGVLEAIRRAEHQKRVQKLRDQARRNGGKPTKPFDRKEGAMGRTFDDPNHPKDGGAYLVGPDGAQKTDATLGEYLDPNGENPAKVYVNGMNHTDIDIDSAIAEAQELSKIEGRPVVLVFNEAPTGDADSSMVQAVTDGFNSGLDEKDKIHGADVENAAGNYVRATTGLKMDDAEPAQRTLEEILAGTRGDVSIEAHSEGNLITSAALRNSGDGVDITRTRVTADASPTGRFPDGPQIVRNEDPDDDVPSGNLDRHPRNEVNVGSDLIDHETGERTEPGTPRQQHDANQYFHSPDRVTADEVYGDGND